MISWIQRYFQRHFKTIFAVLLTVTIISFIFTIGASPGIGSGNRRYVEHKYFGYNLAIAEDKQRLFGDANLSAELLYGAMNIDESQLQQYAFDRAAKLALADQWHIPTATSAEVSDEVKKLRMFSGPNGEFDAKAYATFRDNLKLSPRGPTEADVYRILGDDIRAEKVEKLIGGPGYVLPREIKTQLERSETTWTLGTATVDFTSYKPDTKPTDAELTKFFEDNSFRYEIAPQVVATYVDFPSIEYARTLTATDAEVRAFYDANPARFPKPPEPKPADAKTPPKPANPDIDFAAVRPQVEAALKLERGQKLAIKAASDLALAIYEAKATTPAALDAVLTSHKLQAKPLAPFTREAGPAELGHSQQISDEAFKLGQDHFVSDALPSPTGAVILFWKSLEPAHKPLFSEVRAKVVTDYEENEKQKKLVELGKTAKSQIEARLKSGDSFDKAVAAAASATGLKLTAKTLAPFSMQSRPQDVDYSILGALARLNKGEVSDMIINADKGIIVFAQDKKLPDLSPTSPRYVTMREQLASYSSRLDASALVNEIVSRELKSTEPKPE